MAADAPDRNPAKGSLPLPVLLADRQEVAFVATPRGIESLRIPRRYWGAQVGVVAIPVSEEEVRGAELAPSTDPGAWPRVVTRPDLLAPALSRIMGGEHVELSLQPGRDGLKAALHSGADQQQPYPIAPKDSLGFLAAVFQHAPRGVVKTAGGRARRVVLSVRPAARPHEYRVCVAGVVEAAPPATLNDIGLSPAVLELLLENLERPAGILLVSGGPATGRTTTLDLLALTLVSRGRAGGRVGARQRAARPELPWLAEALSDWPFPESLMSAAPEFILIEHLNGAPDLVLAARLASSGCLVLAGAPAADPGALAQSVARELASGSAPAVPVTVLGQRIVRTPCRSCLGWTMIAVGQARRLGFHRRDIEEFESRGGLAVARGAGCADCARTGFAGLTGVQELAALEEGLQALPRLREEGWRKVVSGTASSEDVMTLPGAQRPMRALREIIVHAGLGQGPFDAGDRATESSRSPVPSTGGPRRAGVPGPAASTEPAVAEAQMLAGILKDCRAAREGSDGKRLAALARTIGARAASDAPLAGLLAPTSGFQVAGHSVNAALIACRIWRALGNEDDPRLALLALVHDAGMVRSGMDPQTEMPSSPSEEALDPSGARLEPGPALQALGAEAAAMEDAVRSLHRLVRFELPTPEDRAAADQRSQVAALGCLVELHRRAPGAAEPIDLHDVTSLVMEQHGRRFSPSLFRALLKAVPIFPIGCLVELSSGDLARVVSLNEDNHFRPRVEITASATGEEHGERRVIDLARAPFLHVRHRMKGPVPLAQVAV